MSVLVFVDGGAITDSWPRGFHLGARDAVDVIAERRTPTSRLP